MHVPLKYIIHSFLHESLFVKISAKAVLQSKNFYFYLQSTCPQREWYVSQNSVTLTGGSGATQRFMLLNSCYFTQEKIISDIINTWDPLIKKFYMHCNCTRHRTGVDGFCVSTVWQLRRRIPGWFSLPQQQRLKARPKQCAVRNPNRLPEHILHRIWNRQCPYHWTPNKSEFL